MKEYDNITLKKLQKVELEILHDFVKICEQNSLTYFGIAGTGIGVLRHGGFIPWDDDIDIAMPRKDMERFIEIVKEQYADKYEILNAKENSNFPLMTTQLVMKGTQFVIPSFKYVKCNFGIYLDVFPLDNIPDTNKEYRKQARKAFVFSKLMILRSVPFPMLAFSGIRKVLIHAVCACVYFLMVLFRVKKEWLFCKSYEACTMNNNMKSAKRLAYVGDTTPYDCIYAVDEIYPLKKGNFEDIQINIPVCIEKKLEETYGDWRTLPPVEKRKSHCPYCLDFGDKEL